MHTFDPTRLRAARVAAGLTATQLAYKIDRAAGTYKGWEAGRKKPSLEALVHAAAILGVDVADLFTDLPAVAE